MDGTTVSWSELNMHLFRFRKENRWRRVNGRSKIRKQNRHHLLNKCRGGDFTQENILMLKVDKHNEWHRIFKNSDPEYIIAVILRTLMMKKYPIKNPELIRMLDKLMMSRMNGSWNQSMVVAGKQTVTNTLIPLYSC